MIEIIQQLLEEAFRQDSIVLYFLMFGGGLLASLTPCTYPMLPITVGYISNQASANRRRTFLLSLSLVTGLGVVYAIIGAMVAAAGGTFGSIMGNGIVLFSIAVYFLIMGLFLLDVFRFPTPSFLSRLQAKSVNRKGLWGAFFLGCVSGLIVGPCTGPILAVALGAIAMTLQNVHGIDYAMHIAKGGILLFLFGLGQGALILLAGTFTDLLSRLPKSGAWMEGVKKGSALLIILFACLLFVFVGQNTDFPNLTRLLALTYPSSSPESKVISSVQDKPPVSAKPFNNFKLAPKTNAKTSGEQQPQSSEKPLTHLNLSPELKTKSSEEQQPQASEKPLNHLNLSSELKIKSSEEQQIQASAEPLNLSSEQRTKTSGEQQRQRSAKPSMNLAPDFTLLSLGGDQFTLSKLKGKKGIVLAFFATWCVSCVKEVAELNEFSRMSQNENIQVVGVNFKQAAEIVGRLKNSEQIKYEILLDREGTVTTEKFGIMGLPHIIGINARGEIIYRGVALPTGKDDFMVSLKQGL
jgi:thiol:disulfide interchange protein DsbD